MRTIREAAAPIVWRSVVLAFKKSLFRGAKPRIETEPLAGATVTAPAEPAAGDWVALMRTGLVWLEQLAAVSVPSSDGGAGGLRFVHRDPDTGEDYVKVPVPSPEVLDGALRTIGRLLDRLRRS